MCRSILAVVTILLAWNGLALGQDSPHAATQPASAASMAATTPAKSWAATTPATAASKPSGKTVWPLSRLTPLPAGELNLQEIQAAWPAFQHEPFEKAGFNAVSLPLHYVITSGKSEPELADAMAFLLSASLDWGPGSYSTRHAYFVFKRAPKQIAALKRQYTKRLIAEMVTGWNATHAVGGTLRQSPEGFSGAIEIFNPQGDRVFIKEYKKPVDFFELLGDMSVDALGFLGPKPGEQLSQHLHRKRCQSRESLLDLGKAAFMEEKSPQEFAVYVGILARDADFADVRVWLATQRYWVTRDHLGAARQNIEACDGYLTINALTDIYTPDFKDAQIKAGATRHLKAAKAILGDQSHPLLEAMELNLAMEDDKVTPELRDAALAAVRRYPNDYNSLWVVGRAFEKCYDYDMAVGIWTAAQANRYWPGDGRKVGTLWQLGTALYTLGYDEQAVAAYNQAINEALRDKEYDSVGGLALATADALFGAGRFAEAAKAYELWRRYRRAENMNHAAIIDWAVACLTSGDPAKCTKILSEHMDELRGMGLDGVAQQYQAMAAGRPVEREKMPKLENPTFHQEFHTILLLSQDDNLRGSVLRRKHVEQRVRISPHCRPFWTLLDQYDRNQPKTSQAAFYYSLEWLYPTDLWVRKAVADFRLRTVQPETVSPEKLLAQLEEFEPVRWPKQDPDKRNTTYKILSANPVWAFDNGIRELLAAKDFERAKELALRYHNLMEQSADYVLIARANHLIHLVAQAMGEEPQQRWPAVKPFGADLF